MKKRMLSLGLMLLLIGGTVLPAHAESFQGGSGWHVAFTEEKKMESNFKSSDMDESIGDLQPGDEVVFTITLQNENSTTTDWWMTNEVLKSLEDNSVNNATGGAYGYVLLYTDRTGEVYTLYDSDRIGGDGDTPAGVGLHAATDALEEFFYLDTLTTGQSGTVTLRVSLDGETQGNDYQDTLANLQMNFAVELNPDGNLSRSLIETSSSITRLSDIVKTDDQTNLTPYYIAMAISGGLILILAICSMKKSQKEKKEAR